MTTVLLVERNDHLRGVLRSRFLREGFRLREATSAAAGLAMARAERPDLIILDDSMRWEDGRGLRDSLDADEALRGVPVVLLTARTRAVKGDEEANARADEPAEGEPDASASGTQSTSRIEHPFRPGQLLELVRTLVRSPYGNEA